MDDVACEFVCAETIGANVLKNRGYPAATLVVKDLSEVKFSERETSLTNKDRTH